MNSQFQEKKGTFLLLLGLLFLLLVVFYFMFFQPLMKESKATENELRQAESDLAIMKAEAEKSRDNVVEEEMDIETMKLAQRLPKEAAIDELILALEEIETISGSRFEGISFAYDGSVPERSAEEEEEDDASQESSEDETNKTLEEKQAEEQEETQDEALESAINLSEKPESLHVITVSMNVTSPDYDHFQIFLQEIEKQHRMMFVNGMDFVLPGEEELLLAENPNELVSANVNITTFYYEE